MKSISHTFQEFMVDNELLAHIENIKKEPNIVADDIGRWELKQIVAYKHDYQVKTYVDSELASIMYFKWYGDFLRINIGMYVLEKFRKDLHRFQFYPNGGAFGLVKQYVRQPKGYFGTFYAKNRKLSALVESLKDRKHRGLGSEETDWDKFAIYHDEPIKVKNVMQWVMYWNQVGDQDENLAELYQILNDQQLDTRK
jgi:hypothetical protein